MIIIQALLLAFVLGVWFDLTHVSNSLSSRRASAEDRRREWCAWERPAAFAVALLGVIAMMLAVGVAVAPRSGFTAVASILTLFGAGVMTSSLLVRPLVGNIGYGVKDRLDARRSRRGSLR